MGLRALVPFLALATSAPLMTACSKPKAGDDCTLGQATCVDEKTELQCDKGRFVAAPCKGPKGCVVTGGAQTCDISGNAAGDSCATDDENVSQCLADKKGRVVCHAGRYAVEKCLGPKGCEESGDKVDCDQSLGAEGDPCAKEDGRICAADLKRSLVCVSGKLVVAEACRGPGACNPTAAVLCDRGLQSPGDPCAKEGDLECGGDDKKSKLVCENRKWSLKEKCKTACVSTAKNVDCDRSTPQPGDACPNKGDRACSGDKKLALVCSAAKEWTSEGACKGGCTTGGDGKVKCDK
jgi:hypothetical protein